jgi:transcriptional regulator with XRE-family HTH domain
MDAATSLRELRKARGWSQVEAARHLRVSQPYLSLLEAGDRPLTPHLRRRLLHALKFPPTVLPLPASLDDWPTFTNEAFVRHLSALGYPPFSYVKPHPHQENPAALFLWALADSPEARLAEALPWILLAFRDLDLTWLVREAKLRDLQNRLGFLAHLAHAVARTHSRFKDRTEQLATLLKTLEPSRLAREETLFEPPLSPKSCEATRALRTPEAAHWNLLTLWKPEHLAYD